jgi:hypothetical protein
MQRTGFVRPAAGGLGNKPVPIGLVTLLSTDATGRGCAMGDENLLLDHARRYFTQAGQGSDIKKMRMLVELGLEFLRLAEQGERTRVGANPPAEPADTPDPAVPDRGDPNAT